MDRDRRSFRGEVAIPVGSGDSAIHKEVATGDECTVRAHQERSDSTNLVRRARAPGRTQFDHAPVTFAAWTAQFVPGQGRDDDSGANRIEPRTALTSFDGFRHHSQRVPTFSELVSVEGILHLIRLEHGEGEQLFSGRRRESSVLLGGQCA